MTDKIGGRFDNIVTANVTLSTDRNRHIVEITLFGKGFEMRAEERECYDMYRSISSVVEKLEKQLGRARERTIDLSRQTREGEGEGKAVAEEAAPAAKPRDSRIEKVSSYVATPMTVEAAIKVLEEKGHVFYTFLNQENGRINVVYSSERGFSLVDPRT